MQATAVFNDARSEATASDSSDGDGDASMDADELEVSSLDEVHVCEQQGSCEVDTDTLAAYLVEDVYVHMACVAQKAAAGVRVTFERLPRRYSRLEFLCAIVCWFARVVICGDKAEEFAFEGTDAEVKKALCCISKILECEPDPAVWVLDKYESYLSACAVGDTAAYYSKDGQLRGSAAELLRCASARFCSDSVVKRAMDADLLKSFQARFDGMKASAAWVYTGGAALAGHHLEDGFMHFVNFMPSLAFNTVDYDVVAAKAGFVTGETIAALVPVLHDLSAKRWTFVPDSLTPATASHLCHALAVAFPVAQPGAAPVADDRVLFRRDLVLLDGQFEVRPGSTVKCVIQRPGQAIVARCSHSVVGGLCSLSFAWNVCIASEVRRYVDMEFGMAKLAGTHTAPPYHMALRGASVSVCLAAELLMRASHEHQQAVLQSARVHDALGVPQERVRLVWCADANAILRQSCHACALCGVPLLVCAIAVGHELMCIQCGLAPTRPCAVGTKRPRAAADATAHEQHALVTLRSHVDLINLGIDRASKL